MYVRRREVHKMTNMVGDGWIGSNFTAIYRDAETAKTSSALQCSTGFESNDSESTNPISHSTIEDITFAVLKFHK
jgi:hypothetical protein